MKKLSQFTNFDAEAFFKDKRFMSLALRSWDDIQTGAHLGSKLEAVIVQDKTNYHTKPGEIVTNLYEKITFKVPKDIDVPLNTEVKPIGVTAKVYGDFKNQLSVQAEDIIVVTK